jgi:hypothetical protein
MANKVMNCLSNDCKVNFSKCRRQSYDNAANMAGTYNDTQKKFLEEKVCYIYVPCAGHLLNPAGRAAVDCCLDTVNCFAVAQQTYTFFSASTKCWAVPISFLDPESTVQECLSDTRWEAHTKAASAIGKIYSSVTDGLTHIHTTTVRKGIQDDKLAFFCRKWKNQSLR